MASTVKKKPVSTKNKKSTKKVNKPAPKRPTVKVSHSSDAKKNISLKKTVAVSSTKKSPKVASVKKSSKSESEVKSSKIQSVSIGSRVDKKVTSVSPLDKLRSLHFTSFFGHLVFAGLSLFFLSKASAQLIVSKQTQDIFANTPEVSLAPSYHFLMNLQYRYVLAGLLIIGAVGSLLLATRLRRNYETKVTRGLSGAKWLLIGISLALTLELASFMTGITELFTLKLIGGLVLTGALFAWIYERENFHQVGRSKIALYGSVFAFILAFIPMVGNLVTTNLYGGQRFAWYVYVLGVILALSVFMQLRTLVKAANVNNKLSYVVTEQRYFWTDVATKFFVLLVLLAGIQK